MAEPLKPNEMASSAAYDLGHLQRLRDQIAHLAALPEGSMLEAQVGDPDFGRQPVFMVKVAVADVLVVARGHEEKLKAEILGKLSRAAESL